jgi:hypothetical protein
MLNLDESSSSEESLTSREAFLAMSDFIWQFGQRAGDDLLTLLGDTDLQADGEPTDPASWEDWLRSVAKIRAGFPPRAQP